MTDPATPIITEGDLANLRAVQGRLEEEAARTIRQDINLAHLHRRLAAVFKVSAPHVGRIVAGRYR